MSGKKRIGKKRERRKRGKKIDGVKMSEKWERNSIWTEKEDFCSKEMKRERNHFAESFVCKIR